MPVVPLYEDRGVRLDPGMNFRDGTRASPDMFGAQVGEALGNVGRGMRDAATAIAQVNEFDDTNRAKDAHNALLPALRDLQYGADGFMGKSGRAAVDSFSGFQASVNDAIRKNGEGLSPNAYRKYMDAAQASANGAFTSAMSHVSEARKVWAAETGNARVAEFANDALVNYSNTDTVNRNIAAGIMELRQTLTDQGHPTAYIRQKELEYSSGIHKNIALRMAQSDPIQAQQYVDANRKYLSGTDQYDLERDVGKAAQEAEDKDAALQFFYQGRDFGGAPDEATTAATGGAAVKPGPTRDKAFLLGKLAAGHDQSHVTNLDGAFATNLAALIQDAPSAIVIANQGYRGAAKVQPISVGETVLFAQRSGGVIRDFSFSYADDAWIGKDLTIMSRHLFENKSVKAWAYSQAPYSVVWVVLDDGSLVSLTYMREHSVWAWTRHESGAGAHFEDVACIAEGGEDVPYFIVRRTINGQTKRYIEKLHTRVFDTVENAFFVDCGLTYAGPPTAVLTGLSHLEGCNVVALADGNVVRGLTVTGGSVTLPNAASKVHVGLPYEGVLQTLDLDLGQLQSLGTVQGRYKSVDKLVLRVEKTRGVFVSRKDEPRDSDRTVEFKQRSIEAWNEAIGLYTGDIDITPPSSWDRSGGVFVKQFDPLPMSILALMPEVALGR